MSKKVSTDLNEMKETEGNKVQMRRVQLDLPPKAFDRLVKLKVDTEAGTYAEVIKNALRLYSAVVQFQEDGNEFMIKRLDGTIMPFPLITS